MIHMARIIITVPTSGPIFSGSLFDGNAQVGYKLGLQTRTEPVPCWWK